jgi:hypothetical protein
MTEFEKLLSNPVVFRIMQVVAASRTATISEIADAIPEISRASMYRYCKRMADYDMLETVSEVKVRGQIQRTYALKKVTISGDDSTNDYMSATLLFLREVHKKYEVYFSGNNIDTRRDKLFMVSPDLNLDDSTYNDLCDRLKSLLLEYSDVKPQPGSRIRNLYLMSAPDESWEAL